MVPMTAGELLADPDVHQFLIFAIILAIAAVLVRIVRK